jgi:hypothetical protein
LAHIAAKNPSTGQSERIMSFLVSLYNGTDFPCVDLAWVGSYMDAGAKRDLAQVFLGCFSDFPDHEIRRAVNVAGGKAADARFLSRCKTAVCFRALANVVTWCLTQGTETKHAAESVRRILLSLKFTPPKGFVPPSLHSLRYVHDDVRDDILLIIDGAANRFFDGNEGETIDSIVASVAGGSAWLNRD